MTDLNPEPVAPRALLFDVFGTVVDWRSSIAREVQAALAGHPVSVDSEAFADRWRALYQPAMARVRSGEIDFVPLDELHRENLDQVLAEFSIDDLSESEKVQLNFAWHRLDAWPDTVAGLERLKRRYIIGTLSNGNIALIVNMAKYSGLPWDVVLGAEVARAYKPQPQAYLGSAQALGLWWRPTMMISKQPRSVVSGRHSWSDRLSMVPIRKLIGLPMATTIMWLGILLILLFSCNAERQLTSNWSVEALP